MDGDRDVETALVDKVTIKSVRERWHLPRGGSSGGL